MLDGVAQREMAHAVHALAMDAVERAKSGHLGCHRCGDCRGRGGVRQNLADRPPSYLRVHFGITPEAVAAAAREIVH
jgi:hypothetical protein